MKILNDRGNEVEVDFGIWNNDGETTVYSERVDVRREKKYGLKLTIRAEIGCVNEPQLARQLAHLVAGGVRMKLPARYVCSAFDDRISVVAFITAESPKLIPDPSAPECAEAVKMMVGALHTGWDYAVEIHTERVQRNLDAEAAGTICRWAAAEIEEEAEKAVDYEGRLAALRAERAMKIAEIAASKNREEWVRANVNIPDALVASERAIKTALAHMDRYIDKKIKKPMAGLFEGVEGISPDDLV